MPMHTPPRYDITSRVPLRSSVDLPDGEMQVALGDYDQGCGPALWSSTQPLPAIGEFVHLTTFGLVQVAGYFIEHGWLGMRVEPLDPPGWWVEQRARDTAERADPPELEGLACMFGCDLLPMTPEQYRQAACRLDEAARRIGCFSSFWDMLNTEPGYRPTVHPDSLDHRLVRRAYDREQARRGDPRRVFPHDPVDGTGR